MLQRKTLGHQRATATFNVTTKLAGTELTVHES